MAALAGILTLVSGCGGGEERQDVNEASGEYPLEIVDASFPKSQSVGESTALRIKVRNPGDKAVPNVALTVDGLSTKLADTTAADPRRPVWIVDKGPDNADTAYVGTWAGGPLPAGEERTFAWQVTAVRPGTHALRYSVAAGLDGKARAVASGDQPLDGSVTARISRLPRDSVVDPETGEVLERSELQTK